MLPVWKRNPDGDFSGAVDDTRLFEFVDQVRSSDRVWTQEFERAQEIITMLRIQFAYLTMEGLRWRLRLRGAPLAALKDLHGEALRLALERPKAWEYRLFGQVILDEVVANENLRREHRLGIVLGSNEYVSPENVPDWIDTQLNELKSLTDSLTNLLNRALPTALGPPSTPRDVAEIVFVAKQIGTGYRHAIEWSQRVRRTHVADRFKQLLDEMTLWTDSIIKNIENYGPDLLRQIDEALATPAGEDAPTIHATLVISISNMEHYQEEFNRVFRGSPYS